MKSVMMLATLGVALQTVALGIFAAEENAPQTKTGTVRRMDAAAKQVVVMVQRELTFTVTESTKIVQGDKSKTLADIAVKTEVSVEYPGRLSRHGQGGQKQGRQAAG